MRSLATKDLETAGLPRKTIATAILDIRPGNESIGSALNQTCRSNWTLADVELLSGRMSVSDTKRSAVSLHLRHTNHQKSVAQVVMVTYFCELSRIRVWSKFRRLYAVIFGPMHPVFLLRPFSVAVSAGE